MKTLLLLFIILPLALFSASPASAPPPDDPPDVCQAPDNILPNCNFNNGLDGWQSFTEDGGANFAVLQGGGECHAPLCPAAYIVAEGHFVGGFYRQVKVTQGNTYFANVVWLVFDSLANDRGVHDATGGIGRRLGIDPTGGTDPRSPNIVWGAENWRNDCKICDKQEVVATAQSDTITLFIRIDDRWKLRAGEKGYPVPPSKDQFWIDDVGMKQVGEEMAVQANPTETPVPPTDTPEPAPTNTLEPVPTDTPEPALTDTPTATETPAIVAQADGTESGAISPVATPTLENTVAPPPTLTPTMTATPTSTPAEKRQLPAPTRQLRATPESVEASLLPTGLLGVAGTTICVGGVVLVIMGLVMGGLVWLYRLGWGNSGGDELENDDNGEEVMVEIVE